MNRLRRLETFARAGYLARGLVYVLLGYFAFTTARSKSPGDILAMIHDAPFGAALLVLVGIGLAFYGLFRLYGAALDLDGDGDDAKGAGKRVGHGLSGLAHLFLSYVAFKGAAGAPPPQADGKEAQAGEAASVLLSLPGGEIVLGLIGLGFLAAAADQALHAWRATFMRTVDADAPAWVEPVGRVGHAARAVVFAIIGWNIAAGALRGSAEQVGGIGVALEKLRGQETVFTLVAIGLFAFGVFGLVMAFYARIRDEDVVARLRREVREARS